MGSKNALSFAAGFGTGYMNEAQRQKEQERQAKLDQIQTDRAAREQTTFEQQQADSRTLRDAAAPVGVEQPNDVLMDDDGNPMPAVPAFRVAGQRYDSLDQAQTAATAANTPGAMAARQAAALNQVGQPAQALQLQSSQADMEAKHAERLRTVKNENIVDALQALRRGDGKGMVAAFNKSGDYKIDGDAMLTPEVREIPGVGKVTTHNATFNVVGPDGQARPMTVNSHDLSMQYMPYEKALSQQLAQVKGAAEVGELNAKGEYYKSFANQKDAQAKGGGTSDKPVKMDEDDKIVFNDANARVRDADKMLNEAYQKLMAGDDPEKSPAVAHAKGVLQQAKANQFKTHVRLGVLSPETIANDIASNAQTPEEVLKSLRQLADAVGPQYADPVASIISKEGVLSRLTKRNGLGAAGPQTPTGKAVAAAPPGSWTAGQSAGAQAAPAAPAASAPAPSTPSWSGSTSGRGLSAAKSTATRQAPRPPAAVDGEREIELKDRLAELQNAKARYVKSKSDTRAIDQAIARAEQELNGR